MQLLRDLADDNRTVLIATHDDAIARQADVVMEMRDGQIVNSPDSPIHPSPVPGDAPAIL